ncbi:Holliday junction branch migration protein RuvA [Candidatus Saccharibacteria bacterium]|nr:Holliday junction branch migration protein RuvA [Candidatus Saccharibacteria bacterium]
MIATLRGEVCEKNSDNIVLEVRGVGYGLIVTSADFGKNYKGADNKFYVYEHIRENSHDLYGFSELDSKKLFEQLISVKNVGPKVAMAVLDTADANIVRANIAAGEIKFLQTAKGVGRRAAEQIIVELRDKVGSIVTEGAEGIVNRSGIGIQDEAAEALIALGFSAQDAAIALEKIDDNLSTEDRIKQALKGSK